MIRCIKNLKVRAFTLIELLVVIAIIAILAAVLTPAVSNALLQGKMTATMQNGVNMYKSLFAKEVEDPVFQTGSPYPKLKGANNPAIRSFPDSTEYFRWIVTNRIMSVNFSYFSAPGISPANSTNAADFTAINNAWCVSVFTNFDGEADNTPLLFTRNLSLAGTKLNGAPTLLSDAPFGQKGMVAVTKGGSGFTLKSDTVTNVFISATLPAADILTP